MNRRHTLSKTRKAFNIVVASVVFGRYSPNQKGFEDPKTNWGYKTLIYFSTHAYWRRPVFREIKREMMRASNLSISTMWCDR